MTKRLNPYRTPELREADYFAGLARWWSQVMDDADRRNELPRIQRSEVVQAFTDWLAYGRATSEGERRRRIGLLQAMVRQMQTVDLVSLPDDKLWLAMCWIVGQYRSAWLKVWDVQMGNPHA